MGSQAQELTDALEPPEMSSYFRSGRDQARTCVLNTILLIICPAQMVNVPAAVQLRPVF